MISKNENNWINTYELIRLKEENRKLTAEINSISVILKATVDHKEHLTKKLAEKEALIEEMQAARKETNKQFLDCSNRMFHNRDILHKIEKLAQDWK